MPPPNLLLVVLASSLTTLGSSCSTDTLPPRGEALLVVDTDVAVPEMASELRLDLYTPQGDWYESKTAVLPAAEDWPASFSLYAPEGSLAVLVRLRIYPRGMTRDYHGERFEVPVGGDPLAVPTAPEPSGFPRLLHGGVDVTPQQEPDPLVAIDRLLALRLTEGERGRVRVLMRGECAGTMANLRDRETCVERAGQRRGVETESIEREQMSVPSESAVGTFGKPEDCHSTPRPGSLSAEGQPLYDEEVCVPGGVFLMGPGYPGGRGVVRVARLKPLLIDKYEVTVGRWRDAIRKGFVPRANSYHVNDGSLVADFSTADSCPYSSSAGSRETLPMACVAFDQAQAFCRFLGGDLPTEAQWEYAATAALRSAKTAYAWGSEAPTCTRTVYQRCTPADTPTAASSCSYLGEGPQPQEAVDRDDGDRTPVLGIVNMNGNVEEFVADTFADPSANCWRENTIDEPSCLLGDTSGPRTTRGSGWVNSAQPALLRSEFTNLKYNSYIGFRCVRPGASEP